MSIKALQDYTIYAKYAKYEVSKKRRETWSEQIDRVFNMYENRFSKQLQENEEFRSNFNFAKKQVLKRRVLGSQRALQFGGAPIEKHEAKMYNCAFGHVDVDKFFNECMYLLLCGTGVGFSVQKHHIRKLPNIAHRNKGKKKFVISDSIEGWADAIGIVVNSYFRESETFNEYNGYEVEFDFSKIRPTGSLISGGFKAPGPEGLKRSIQKIEKIFETRLSSVAFDEIVDEFGGKLRPIDAYDVIMHMSDAVLSGGVRRSATICLFSPDDDEMLHAKTGKWFTENPQRGRSNNSVLLVRDKTTKEDFERIMNSVKEFGEPGFVFTENTEIGFNPCCEIGLYPKTEDGRSGFQFCNLTEINGKKCKTEEDFLQACRASAIIGTLQASFTNFKYLSSETKEITERESLLGCSITGMMDSPEILFDDRIQRRGAEEIKKMNSVVAKVLGINPAARTCAIKPAGTTSCVLGSSSGIHPHHAKRYFRNVQANVLEFPVQEFERHNPLAVQNSVWSNNNTDKVITFLCEVPVGSVTKNQVKAIELLERVKLTQQNWVESGTREELCSIDGIRHNVSNTITVQPDEWDGLTRYIYENRKWFAGISLLPSSGDKDYPQAPFTTVFTMQEIVKEYGDASGFASGLIVDALKAFDNNLWKACDTVLGIGEELVEEMSEPEYPKARNYKQLSTYFEQREGYDNWWLKKDWIRRAKQFATRYFEGDIRKMTYCLKDVSNWKKWCDLNREYKDIDWSQVVEEDEWYQNVDETAGAACSGGKCEWNV